MNRAVVAVAALPLALLSLTACGEAGDKAEAKEHAVPSGVLKQYETLHDEVSERGGSTTAGDWTVSYIVEAAEPWFEGKDLGTFREPKSGETNHIEIIPTETTTGRIVPGVPITLEILDADGKVVEKQKLNFYYSTFFHYANNFHLPESGTYTLRATLGVPTFHRHGDQAEGPALAEGATVEFDDVAIATE